ncbi:MAG TPA: hypothetical protein VG012_00325 [Acidimicrobiia bacterium]|nr:hypothetical protein [Acidimicrobiia bacterium]
MFSGLTAVGLWQHVMWFDELQAWNIARASHSLGGLYRNLRYEGHPLAWYLVLYGVTRFTGDPRAMQLVELVVVTATAALVLFRSPFTLPVRVAMLAGYSVAFEYGVISRSYSLGLLALVVVLVALGRPRPAWGAALAAAALLAWTSLAGAVLTVALAAAVALDRRGSAPPAGTERRARRRFVLGALLAAVGAALTCLPPRDFHEFTPGLGNLATTGTTRVAHAATGIWRGLFPIPARVGAWNSQLLDRLPAGRLVEAALSLAVFVVVLVGLRSPLARRLWCLGVIGCELFFAVVVLPDQARYAGTVFVLFLAVAWLARAPGGGLEPAGTPLGWTRPRRAGAWASVALGAVVTAQVVATLAVYPSATIHPFSPDRALAEAARAHQLSGALVSDEDFVATGVGAYLDRSTYSAARRAWTPFFVHDDRQAAGMRAVTPADAACAAARLAVDRGRATGLISARALRGPGLRRLTTVDHVSLYAVTKAASAGCRRKT